MAIDFSLNVGTTKSKRVKSDKLYDTLIIGGGPAGLNAALYAKRKGLQVGILTQRIGGQVLDTKVVENYLGYTKITGEELMREFEDHVNEYDVPISDEMQVKQIKCEEYKEIHTTTDEVYKAKTVIIATGSIPRMLGIPGEKEFNGKGVSYCAICDGSLYQDGIVMVIGGGNAAIGSALDLSRIAKKVMIVHRSTFRADQILLDRLNEQKNIDIYLETEIKEIKGQSKMTHVITYDKDTKLEKSINVEGLFVEIGHVPRTEYLNGLIELENNGEIIVDSNGETSEPGIFAAGDVTNVKYKQIVIAAAEGAKAALSATEYINKGKH
ncbi:MAG: FAD-dependent oxidoreductase [Clostridiales bacterium]|nr:FAD-dependent oxidoreductase [Clostridiales bacterium]